MAGDEYPSAAFVETGFVADKWSAAEELSRIADIAITTAATDAAFVVPVASTLASAADSAGYAGRTEHKTTATRTATLLAHENGKLVCITNTMTAEANRPHLNPGYFTNDRNASVPAVVEPFHYHVVLGRTWAHCPIPCKGKTHAPFKSLQVACRQEQRPCTKRSPFAQERDCFLPPDHAYSILVNGFRARERLRARVEHRKQ